MTVKTLILASITFLFSATGVFAACSPDAERPVPAFETAKRALLVGDYDTFFDVTTPFVLNREERRQTLVGPLERLVPDGFPSCVTVVSRFEAPALYQEVVFLEVTRGYLGLYLRGVEVNGDVRIVHFAYSDMPSDMIDKLE